MTIELLQTKSDYKKLGKNWVLKYPSRYLILWVKYSHILNWVRFLASDYNIIPDEFNLYQFTKVEYIILNKNIFNIDKNEYMIGIAGSSKVVFSKYQK